MALTPADLRFAGRPRPAAAERERDLPFDDLVYLLAESVADAQSKLDAGTAQTLQALAETEVDVVPSLTRTVGEDGAVETAADEPVARSLLELGFEPTRYQFSEATVDVEFDLSITERERSETERDGTEYGLRAGTYEVREQRRYSRDVEGTARLSATLQPVPLPVNFPGEPGVETADGDEGAGDGE